MKAYMHILRTVGISGDDGVVNAMLSHDPQTPFSPQYGQTIETINLDPSEAFQAGWNAAANRNPDGMTDDEISEARAVDEIAYLEK